MSRRRRDGNESNRITLAPGMLAVPNVRLIRKIAEGGMGSVWEAEHLGLRTNVAVKFVLDELGDNTEAAARFDREATAAARIKSPHVVQTLDHGLTSEGVAYIVMELLEGEDLETRLLREPRLPLELVAHIVGQSAKALEKAHGLGIVHRDIKPPNVFLTDVGGEVFVKILDFGIAKLSLANVAQMRVTQTGSMIGTPVFMAPEQMTQAKDVGPAADMWSLGVVAYVALTGKLPYDSDTIAGLAMAIERGVFPAATSVAPGLPAGIDAWFDRALAKDPAGRFGTIREMSDAMAKLAGTHVPISSALQTKMPSTPPAAIPAPPPSAAESEPKAKPEAKSDEPRPRADAPPEPSPAALAATLHASPIASATIMGASSEKARQEVRSSTRTLIFAGVAIGALGTGAVLYGVLVRGDSESQAGAHSSAPATAPVSGEAHSAVVSATTAEHPASGATGEPSTATTAPSTAETSAPPAVVSTQPTASASASVRPRLTGTLPPRVAPSGSASATPPASAHPKASASASTPPAPSAPAPKPSASAPAPPPPAGGSAKPPAPKPSAAKGP